MSTARFYIEAGILENAIRDRLRTAESAPKRQLVVSLEEDTIDRMDRIARVIAKQTGKSTSRNMLIEEAVEAYVGEATRILMEEGIEISAAMDGENYDTVIFPAHADGFHATFLGENQWRWVRVREDRIEQLKYIGIYVGTPESRITHYAKIATNGFVYDDTEKKYRVLFDGQPIALDHPIPLGEVSAASTRAPRYTTLAKLLSAETYGDL